MKVVVVASYARSLLNFRGHLLSTLIRLGCSVMAVGPEADDHVLRQLGDLGVTYVTIPMRRSAIDPVSDLRYVLTLRRWLSKERPDLVLTYTAKPVVFGSLAAKSAGVPKVCSMITGLGYVFAGTSMRQVLIRKVLMALYRLTLARNDVVFFQNPDDMKLLASSGVLGNARPVLIPGSGVDLAHFSPAPPVTEPMVFLLIARLLREKGVYEFIEAAHTLKSRYPQVRFVLVGAIDNHPSAIPREHLDQWVEEGLIEYTGWLEDVRPAIRASSVYVLPSYYREGTPRSILEAMAMARPVITTDTPGCRDTVIHGKTGLLVPPRDSDALASAMETFILRPELVAAMGEQSRKLAEERYDVHKVNAVILDALGIHAVDPARQGTIG